MSMSKSLTKIVKTTFKTVAVDVPERPDLVFVYARQKKADAYKTFLMPRGQYEHAESPDDLNNIVLENIRKTSERKFSQVNAVVIKKDVLEDLLVGRRRQSQSAEFGQELGGEYRLVIYCVDALTSQIVIMTPDEVVLHRNLVLTLTDVNYELDRILAENPNFVILPSETGDTPFYVYDFGPRQLRISLALSDEQHETMKGIKDYKQIDYIEANTDLGKYRRATIGM